MVRGGLLHEVPGGISPTTQRAVRELNAHALVFLNEPETPNTQTDTPNEVPSGLLGIPRPGGRRNPRPAYPY